MKSDFQTQFQNLIPILKHVFQILKSFCSVLIYLDNGHISKIRTGSYKLSPSNRSRSQGYKKNSSNRPKSRYKGKNVKSK